MRVMNIDPLKIQYSVLEVSVRKFGVLQYELASANILEAHFEGTNFKNYSIK